MLTGLQAPAGRGLALPEHPSSAEEISMRVHCCLDTLIAVLQLPSTRHSKSAL
jgi:hypothetical protein